MGERTAEQLHLRVDELTKLCELKDEQLQQSRQKVSELRSDLVQISRTESPDATELNMQQFSRIEDENVALERENDELKRRYIVMLAKKNEYRKRYRKLKTITIPASPQSPSGLQAENQSLRQRVTELSHDLECTIEEKSMLDQEVRDLQAKLESQGQKLKLMRAEATQKFDLLKAKLEEERAKRPPDVAQVAAENEELTKRIAADRAQFEQDWQELMVKYEGDKTALERQNRALQETVSRLQASEQEAGAAQLGFLQMLEQTLGASTLAEAIQKVEQLREQSAIHEGSALAELREAFQQILQNLSPNALNLPADSELRQLFAALCNMLHSALDPLARKSVLLPHIRAVVYQARLFAPKRSPG
jgi:hypothetical protein